MHNIQSAGLINQAPTKEVEIATLPSVTRNDNLLHEIAQPVPSEAKESSSLFAMTINKKWRKTCFVFG